MQEKNQTPTVIISATHSGAGKTTVTRALLVALKERGLVVQPFKIGPDFIDPMYHTAIVGRPSVNLDLWMMGEAEIRKVFARWTADADVAVIEGMGALFDGAKGTDEGSAAHLARILNVPVVVVIDVYGMTRTAGALMDGLDSFDPEVQIAGFILNRCGRRGSLVHANLIKEGIGNERWNRVLSVIGDDPHLRVAEGTLGLVTPSHDSEGIEQENLRSVAEQMDVERIFGTSIGQRTKQTYQPAPAQTHVPRTRLAVAKDAAFCFYYAENLAALQAVGFEIVEFSPVAGDPLPPNTHAVYLGGGYLPPFASQLAENKKLAAQLRQAAVQGMPIYAECSGLLYLGRSLRDFRGSTYQMSGVLPMDFVVDADYLQIRYLELTTQQNSIFGPAGTIMRGQEFHQIRVEDSDLTPGLYRAKDSEGQEHVGGYQQGNVVASLAYVYFNSSAGVATRFLKAAQAFRKGQQPVTYHD